MPKATTIKTSEKSKEMEKLLAMEKNKPVPRVGDLITGKIISVGKNEVLLDVDGLTTGVVRGYERYDESGEYSNLKAGSEVSATVIDLENEKGQIELSFRYAGHIKAWEKLKRLVEDGKIVEIEVADANKGGLIIKLGNIMGFLPVSQLSLEHYPRVEGGNKNKILEKLRSFVGKKMKVKVITVSEEEEKLIVSEKATLKEEQEKTISKYKIGDIVEGKISGVVDFGAFVEFVDGVEGLVHISELAWQRIDDPRDVVKPGNKVKAEIIDINNSKISLSIKKLLKDPWSKISEKYKVGQVVEGRVLKVNPFGLFVELDDEIHGLAHISELSTKPIANVSEVAKIGDRLKFKVISVEPKDHRLGLSVKALAGSTPPFAEAVEDKKASANKKKTDDENKDKEDEKRENRKLKIEDGKKTIKLVAGETRGTKKKEEGANKTKL